VNSAGANTSMTSTAKNGYPTEHDLEKTGFVKLETFSSMMHEFLVTPVKHGLTTPSKDTYETLFKKYDPRNDGRLTVDEWMSLAKEEVYKKFL